MKTYKLNINQKRAIDQLLLKKEPQTVIARDLHIPLNKVRKHVNRLKTDTKAWEDAILSGKTPRIIQPTPLYCITLRTKDNVIQIYENLSYNALRLLAKRLNILEDDNITSFGIAWTNKPQVA